MSDEFKWDCTDICPYCDDEIHYESPNDGNFVMKCPSCGKEFKMCDKCEWVHGQPCGWGGKCPAGNLYGEEY